VFAQPVRGVAHQSVAIAQRLRVRLSEAPGADEDLDDERLATLRRRLIKTTQGYIDLAGETFREEKELLEARLFGQKSGQK
jgi:hypothetical protein